ncbi:YdcF family protein [Chitinophaga qingshengii]|uniref:YdcF family protein n=1 Tax=Chitinophaga qingshengii TaxID=1569794 RepID=A0ABR7TXX2_9BACT|nr:YdcF family protein [Chitinophaga qingshengii]MBC9934923.1 YdcF family protein [Chitinophaga qingshengii]
MNKLLIVLGAPNDHLGNLSAVAKDRLTCAAHFYTSNDDFKLVCTGGFGEHFNTTDQPHYYYAKQFLINNGVPENVFLDCPPSANTWEDFQLTKDLVWDLQPDILVIITSDFHLPRAKTLFDKIIHYPKVVFVPASSSLTEAELLPLLEHEQRALTKIRTTTV